MLKKSKTIIKINGCTDETVIQEINGCTHVLFNKEKTNYNN